MPLVMGCALILFISLAMAMSSTSSWFIADSVGRSGIYGSTVKLEGLGK